MRASFHSLYTFAKDGAFETPTSRSPGKQHLRDGVPLAFGVCGFLCSLLIDCPESSMGRSQI